MTNPTTTNNALVAFALDCAENVARAFVARYGRDVLGTSEDVRQFARLFALETLARGDRSEDEIRNRLFKIVANKLRQLVKREKARHASFERYAEEKARARTPSLDDLVALNDALEGLTEIERAVALLLAEGRRRREIADALAISLWKYDRVRKAVKKKFNERKKR